MAVSVGLLAALGGAGGAAAGAGVLGSVLVGAAQGFMESRKEKAAEQSRIDEEKRREARYKGSGEAMRFWDKKKDETMLEAQDAQEAEERAQKAGRGLSSVAPSSQMTQQPAEQSAGQKFVDRARKARERNTRHVFNPAAGRIELQTQR